MYCCRSYHYLFSCLAFLNVGAFVPCVNTSQHKNPYLDKFFFSLVDFISAILTYGVLQKISISILTFYVRISEFTSLGNYGDY